MKAFDHRHRTLRLLIGAGGAAALIVGWRIDFPQAAPRASHASADAPALRRLTQPVVETAAQSPTVIEGQVNGSLYESAQNAGAGPITAAEMVEQFSHKLDLARDIHPGERFRLVVDAGDLVYAQIGDGQDLTRIYRYQPQGAAQPEFVDDNGRDIKGLLLRTPIDGAHVTSAFGMRLHPLLGYSRMHQGMDFGAPVGTPVYAAGDGVVEEAAWRGGYGRWLKLGHAGGWETGYGHLSDWLVRPGDTVRQGQAIALTGSSGESTGPHLHYEVIRNGVKIDPEGAGAPSGAVLGPADLTVFRAERARLNAILAPDAATAPYLVRADLPKAAEIGLRTGENP